MGQFPLVGLLTLCGLAPAYRWGTAERGGNSLSHFTHSHPIWIRSLRCFTSSELEQFERQIKELFDSKASGIVWSWLQVMLIGRKKVATDLTLPGMYVTINRWSG